jgi:hypothetical protein
LTALISFNVSFPHGTEETPRKFTKKKGKENEASSESMQSSSEQAHRLLNRIKSKLTQIRCGKIALSYVLQPWYNIQVPGFWKPSKMRTRRMDGREQAGGK